ARRVNSAYGVPLGTEGPTQRTVFQERRCGRCVLGRRSSPLRESSPRIPPSKGHRAFSDPELRASTWRFRNRTPAPNAHVPPAVRLDSSGLSAFSVLVCLSQAHSRPTAILVYKLDARGF